MDETSTHPGAVLITGAAKRIGKAIALDMGKRGWKVGVHYRKSEAQAQAVAAQITDMGGTAKIFPIANPH